MGLMTRWGRQLSEEQALDEYPRPAMVRSDWQNLNGYWDYCFTEAFRKLKVKPGKRAVALTEHDGYSWLVKGHSSREKVYGYRCYESGEALTHGYAGLMRDQILPAVKKGFERVAGKEEA